MADSSNIGLHFRAEYVVSRRWARASTLIESGLRFLSSRSSTYLSLRSSMTWLPLIGRSNAGSGSAVLAKVDLDKGVLLVVQ